MRKLRYEIVFGISLMLGFVHSFQGQNSKIDYATSDVIDIYCQNLHQMNLTGKVKSIRQQVYAIEKGENYRSNVPQSHYIFQNNQITEYPFVEHFFFETLKETPSSSLQGYQNVYLEFDEQGNKTRLIGYKDTTEIQSYKVEYAYDERMNMIEFLSYKEGAAFERMNRVYNDRNELILEVETNPSGVKESTTKFRYFYNSDGRLNKKEFTFLDKNQKDSSTGFMTFEYFDNKNEIVEAQKKKKGKKVYRLTKSFNAKNQLLREERKQKKAYKSRRFSYDVEGRIVYDLFTWQKGMLLDSRARLNFWENDQLVQIMETAKDPTDYSFPITYYFSFVIENQGTLLLKEFEFDSVGNWNKMRIYLAATDGRWPYEPAVFDNSGLFKVEEKYVKLEFHPIYTLKRTIEYYQTDNIML